MEQMMGIRKETVRVKKKTLEMVLQQCQLALQQLASGCDDDEDVVNENTQIIVPDDSGDPSSASASSDTERNEFYSLLKSRIEGIDFLEKLENAQGSLHENVAVDAEEDRSWDMVSNTDRWEDADVEFEREDYVLVGPEDIMDGIASFMAAYLSSLEETKDVTPNQLQAALRMTFSVKKKKSKFRKAWEGGQVIYNVASWGATAIGIYQNPALFRAASSAFWTSCHVISKLF